MATEPITGQTYQEAGSLQTDALQNAQLDYFAAWLNCVVLSVGDTAPPGSPTNGDRYIVGASATGEWATHDDALAVYRDGWQFYAPIEGVAVKDLDSGDDYEFVSAAWTVKAGGGGGGDVVGPASSTDSHVALFDGVTGKLLKDGGALAAVATSGDAEDVTYDNTASGLTATDVQAAIDEIAAGGGGGLTNWTEGVNSSTPNATVPVVSLTATNAATNVDAAITAKGTGATVAQVADNSTTGGNKRGMYATDWQKSRSAAAHVASGTYSVIGGGRNNTASGSDAVVAGGTNNTAIGNYSAIAGGSGNAANANYSTVAGGQTNVASGTNASVGGGFGNTASGTYSYIPGGVYASTLGLDSVGARASGRFTNAGDAQAMCAVLRRSTTDATPGTMTHEGGTGGTTSASATNQLVLPNNSAMAIKATVIARQNSTGDTASWDVVFTIKRGSNAASTAIVGTVSAASIAADSGAAAWTIGVTANTTFGCPTFTVTGEASKSIMWVADVYSAVLVTG